MDTIRQLISNEGTSKIKLFIYLVGLLYVLNKSKQLALFLFKVFLRKQKNFAKRYGAGSYAFITGSSDGIGKQFAIEMIKSNMGVVLVARNKEKLENVKEELLKVKADAKIHIVVADFKNSNNPEFFKNIMEQIKGLDISILINNVGMDYFNYFDQIDDTTILDHIKVNCLPMTFLCRQFIPLFKERLAKQKKKSAILNVGSFAGVLPCIYFNVYGATKAYVNVFTRTLVSEFPEIDIMCLNPSEVSTPMIGNRPPDAMTITSNSCAKWALKDLGYESVTAGHWNHKIQTELYLSIPYFIYNYVNKNFVAPEWFKERELFYNKRK
ncbi:hypothetical protein ABPG74_015412 [Tetrahymena malaccensis]